MQRPHINTVTEKFPVLIPCIPEEQDGLATFDPELSQPQPVRVLTDADLRSNRRFKEMWSTMTDYEREEFSAVHELLEALRGKDKAIARAREHVNRAFALKREGDKKLGITPAREDDMEYGRILLKVYGLQAGQEREAIQRWNGYRLGPRARTDDRWLLSQLLSSSLDSVRLVFWWSGQEFRPALYCGHIKAAIYAFVFRKIVAGTGWGVCPHCGQFFLQKRSDQTYCTIAHREAHRVARWRAAKAARSKKRGGQNGPRKAR
jgi:hypothetical protein